MEGKNNRIIIIAPSSSAFFCCLPSVVVVIGGTSSIFSWRRRRLTHQTSKTFFFFSSLFLRLCLVSSGRGWPVWATKRSSQASSESLQLSSALHCVFSMISYGSWEEERLLQGRTESEKIFSSFPAINIIGGLITHIRRMLKSQTREEKRDLLKDCRIYVYVDGKIFFSFTSLAPKLIALGMYIFTNHSSSLQRTAIPLYESAAHFSLKIWIFTWSPSLSAVLTNWCYEIFCQH